MPHARQPEGGPPSSESYPLLVEALIAFAGIALGWVLAEVSERRRTYREGRAAATLVAFELLQARQLLEMATESDGTLHRYPTTVAWDTHATTLLRWKAGPLGLPLMSAYNRVSSDVAMLEWLEAERQGALLEVKEITTRSDTESTDEMDERARSFLRQRIDLAVRKQATLSSTLAEYLRSVSTGTVPAIDAAVHALKPYVND